MKPIQTLDDIKRLFELMKEFKIDFIDVEGIKVTKTRHELPQPKVNPLDDDDLFQE